jgi:hypothetical protein
VHNLFLCALNHPITTPQRTLSEYGAEAVEETRAFVRTNADLIAHPIEGVPWAEALKGEAFPKELMTERQGRG